MADDIRTRLSEALDQAERLAKAAAKSAPAPWTADVFGGDGSAGMLQDSRGEDLWDCEGVASLAMAAPVALHAARWDPSTVLRLIERDRALAAHYWRVVDSVEEADSTTGRTIRRVMAETLAPEFERLTAFWLGTPEVDR